MFEEELTMKNILNIFKRDKPKIEFQDKIIIRAQGTLDQLDKALDKYIDMEYVTRGLKERKKQEEERKELNKIITDANAEIIRLNNLKYDIEKEQLKIEADVGPIKYIAELIYGDQAKDMFDEAVRLVIIILIFVFDPLAVLLLIAANISLRTRREENKEIKDIEDKKLNTSQRLRRAQDALSRLRSKEKKYKSFFNKLGKRNLTNRDYEEFFKQYGTKELTQLGLDPDEIRLKLDQIMEWNDQKNNPTS